MLINLQRSLSSRSCWGLTGPFIKDTLHIGVRKHVYVNLWVSKSRYESLIWACCESALSRLRRYWGEWHTIAMEFCFTCVNSQARRILGTFRHYVNRSPGLHEDVVNPTIVQLCSGYWGDEKYGQIWKHCALVHVYQTVPLSMCFPVFMRSTVLWVIDPNMLLLLLCRAECILSYEVERFYSSQINLIIP